MNDYEKKLLKEIKYWTKDSSVLGQKKFNIKRYFNYFLISLFFISIFFSIIWFIQPFRIIRKELKEIIFEPAYISKSYNMQETKQNFLTDGQEEKNSYKIELIDFPPQIKGNIEKNIFSHLKNFINNKNIKKILIEIKQEKEILEDEKISYLLSLNYLILFRDGKNISKSKKNAYPFELPLNEEAQIKIYQDKILYLLKESLPKEL
ncbi:MAG: hypothetical protein HUU50_13780 [Candidatus Brocadiae bacterium]|nr:hypothetical protein [Candidatus Brocadiia bacterium]